MRLIDADKLEKKAKFNLQTGSFIELSDLQKAPPIDAEPVVHGHWERPAAFPVFPFCSICNSINSGESNYCSNCGAKMDEEAED